MKKEQAEKAARREKWSKRKRLPKRDPINSEIYNLLIKESEGAEEGWISIDRLKRGPANHKAFLTSEGRKIVKARKRDFEFLFLMKDEDSYIFTSDRKPNQKLGRQQIKMDVNRDTKDIEFVRQTIGHRSLNSTSNYVSDMGNEERENQTSQIEATPLPGADGFVVRPNRPRGRQTQNQCRSYGIISRAATSAGSQHNNNGQDSYYEPSLNSTFEKKQLQTKFEHAKDFGVEEGRTSIIILIRKLI
eukprot:scaffold25934_cov1914-Cylindrotheca_fusiformis.AAC.1